jgi:hypothetical protein
MNVDRSRRWGGGVGFAGMAAGVAGMSPAVLAANECPLDGAIGIGSDGADLGANVLVYVELDPFVVAKGAYTAYGRGGFMNSVFDAVVKDLAVQGHEDACNFAAIATNITVYGDGGVKGWGSICGGVNATEMIVNILKGVEQAAAIGAPTRKDDVGELLTAAMIGQSTANSILCHTSVTNWSAASQFGGAHAAKSERCAQVTAEVAFKTVEFLNLSLKGMLTTDLKLEIYAKENDGCATCHTGTKRKPEAYLSPDVNSKMECQTCHAPHDEIGKNPHHAEESCSTCHPK